MELKEQVPLAPLTTFGIGGQARFFVKVLSLQDLRDALAFGKEKNLSALILGGGSNILLRDEPFEGLVIHMAQGGIETKDDTMTAAAGESWDALVEKSVQQELWGIENLSGIPGTVGGAVVQSIGAYGQAIAQTLLYVDALDRTTGEVIRLSLPECRFGYRTSIFKSEENRYIVLSATFVLSRKPRPALSYKDLTERFKNGVTPSLSAIRTSILEIRKGKFPDLALEGTAGSFFKNPILSFGEASALRQKYPEMPVFEMPETEGLKIPLAWLLDRALAAKGMAHGGARLFEHQPLVIAARFGTSSSDVRALAEEVRALVQEKCSLTIEPEVKIL